MNQTIILDYKSLAIKLLINKKINYYLAKVKVINKYWIRIIKDQWILVSEICIQLNQKIKMKFIIDWIFACYILYNMFVDLDNI